MRAMLLERPKRVEENPLVARELPTPVPARDQVRVHVRVCGICRTDLHTVEGDLALPVLPIVPGHQIVGTVDAVGDAVTSFRVGDRVGIPWLNSTDGQCSYCLQGDENLCDNGRFTGYHVDGGYAEYVVVAESFAYQIPERFTDEEAAPLLCAGVIGYRSFRLSAARPGDRVGLYGFGGSAHIVIQMARHVGCEVYVFTRAAGHRDLAIELGASWVGTAEDRPPEPL